MITTHHKRIFKRSITALCLLLVSVCVPLGVEAQSDTSSNTGVVYVCPPTPGPNGQMLEGNCTYNDLLLAVKKIMDFAIKFALAFSVVIVAIAGGKYMLSEGNPGKIKEANKMFVSVGWGILFVLGAWLIVNLIVTALIDPNLIKNTYFPLK